MTARLLLLTLAASIAAAAMFPSRATGIGIVGLWVAWCAYIVEREMTGRKRLACRILVCVAGICSGL